MELNQNPHCHGICASNTVSYDFEGLGEKIWAKKTSPLAHLGGGGISSRRLKPYVCRWISKLRDRGFAKSINGGGGIYFRRDIDDYHKAGASSVFLGSVLTLWPFLAEWLISYANQLNWRDT